MKHLLFVPAFALLAAMALVGCSDDNGGTDPRIPATSVVVDVTEQELHVGETLQLTATPTPANTTDKVQWTSDDPATATVSETGLVTAVALGSTSVKAVCGEVRPRASSGSSSRIRPNSMTSSRSRRRKA